MPNRFDATMTSSIEYTVDKKIAHQSLSSKVTHSWITNDIGDLPNLEYSVYSLTHQITCDTIFASNSESSTKVYLHRGPNITSLEKLPSDIRDLPQRNSSDGLSVAFDNKHHPTLKVS